MPNLNFKYGASYQNLPEAISNGTIYVTKNEKAMYVDLDGARLRLGQTIVFPDWDTFDKSVTLPPESPEAFYYIEDQNALLKYVGGSKQADGSWSGGYWNQINSVSDIQADLTDLQAAVSALLTTTTAHGGRLDNLEAADIQINAVIDAEIKRAKAAEEANTNLINQETLRAQGKENEISGKVTQNTTDITNIKNNYVKTTTYEAGVAGLQNQITSNDTDIENLQDALTSVNAEIDGIDERVTDNTNAISGLNTTVGQHTSQIAELDTKATNLNTKIENETTRAKNAEEENTTAINAEINRAKSEEGRIESLVSGLSSTVGQHGTKIATLENKVGSAAADGNAATGLFKAIADETTRATTKENALNQSIENATSTLQGNINTVDGKVTQNATEITNIKNNYVKTTTYEAGIENLQNQITSNDGDIKKLQDDLGTTNGNLAATTKTANDNTSAISGLNTTVGQHTSKISTLESTTSTLGQNLEAEIARAKKAEGDNAAAIGAEVTRAQGEENRLEELITGNATAISKNAGDISKNAKDIADLTAYVGTLPEDTEAEDVVSYILEQFAAANAMTYQGSISEYGDLPTTGVEAGFTYIVTSDFVYGGKSYYAGDLVVAAADLTGDTYNGGWTHVNTGYSASQENKLVLSGNGVQLLSYANTNLGALAFASGKVTNAEGTLVDQFKIESAYNSNNKTTTVTLSLEWGTF